MKEDGSISKKKENVTSSCQSKGRWYEKKNLYKITKKCIYVADNIK